jgi:hypothetical protein
MAINRVLTDVDRVELQPVCDRMREYWPELYSRKIDRSMVQYAFCYDFIDSMDRTFANKSLSYAILAVGAQECIASECLKLSGDSVVSIDPVFNCDLHTFVSRYHAPFDFVLAASVLEHVDNVGEFIADACNALAVGGYGVFTLDFNNGYQVGDRLPYTDLRFFNAQDLTGRLRDVLRENGCDLIDEPDYSAADNFQYDGCIYSFATFVFKKG